MNPTLEEPLRIAIVEDHPLTRFALRQLIEANPGWVVASETESPGEFLAALPEADPQVAIVDLGYGDESGLDLLPRLKQDRPDLKTLVYSAQLDKDYADLCFRLGAIGYICKDEPIANVREAIECVAKGLFYVSRSLEHWVVSTPK